MPAVVAKLDDLVEKDPGLLGRIVAVIVVAVLASAVSLWSLYLLFFSDTFHKTTTLNLDGTTTKVEYPWFAWAGPWLTLSAMGLILLACLGYFVKVVWPQLKGRAQ